VETDGLENIIVYFNPDEDYKETLDAWLNSKRSDKRKEMISKNEFDIIKL
jgi:hypothetical protein